MMMDLAIILGLWREACRHLELSESLPNFARLLEPVTGPIQLDVVALGGAGGAIELKASSGAFADLRFPADLDDKASRALAGWAREEAVMPLDAFFKRFDIRAHVGIDAASGGWVAGLRGPGEEAGLLLVLAASMPQAGVEPLVPALRDPVAVAFMNHERLHEIERLRAAAEVDRDRLRERLGRDEDAPLIGATGGLREVMERVTQVAPSDIPVLLLGETGCGKEVVAREIHTRSRCAHGPFIRVNCGAIPPELLDSELFGHERGSFTGATSRRQGWFERADGGTLLLDEIGDLPPPAQVRLLRVLQDGLVIRVGAEREIPVHVRIIAATHRDLPQMVQSGEFRADLWYRIATFPIVIPPLRERHDDIPALAGHFARRAARRFGLRACDVSARDLERLASYPWPGNVREFAAVLDRATILGNGRCLAIDQALGFESVVPTSLLPRQTDTTLPTARHAPGLEQGNGFLSHDQAVKEHIERALARSRGRIEGRRGAASLLDLNPHTLRGKMRKLGIDWRRYRDNDA